MVGTGDSDCCPSAQPRLCLGTMKDPPCWTMLLIRQTHHRRGGSSGAKRSDSPTDVQKVSGKRGREHHPDLLASGSAPLVNGATGS